MWILRKLNKLLVSKLGRLLWIGISLLSQIFLDSNFSKLLKLFLRYFWCISRNENCSRLNKTLTKIYLLMYEANVVLRFKICVSALMVLPPQLICIPLNRWIDLYTPSLLINAILIALHLPLSFYTSKTKSETHKDKQPPPPLLSAPL